MVSVLVEGSPGWAFGNQGLISSQSSVLVVTVSSVTVSCCLVGRVVLQ